MENYSLRGPGTNLTPFNFSNEPPPNMLRNFLKTPLFRSARSSAPLFQGATFATADNFLAAKRDLNLYGASALRPTKQLNKNGQQRYRKPKISGRKANILRKAAKFNESYVEQLSEEVDADSAIHFKPSWDKSGPIFLASKPNAAALHQKRKLARVAEIDAQLAKQDDLMKKHRKNLQDAKPKTFFDKLQASRPVV